MIKLIAVDMDGTLLDPNQQITPGNRKALQEAQRQGIHICFCSGRIPERLREFAMEAGVPSAHILAMNGGCRLNPLNEPTYINHFVDRKAAEICLNTMDRMGVYYLAFHENTRFESGADDFAAANAMGINKLACIEDADPKLLVSVREALAAATSEIEIFSSWHNNIEIMPRGVNKGSAILELAHELGLTRNEIMAIGDNGNDLAMIQAAGCGVCMGNGVESVKAAADYVTGTNAEDGVAQAIYKLALTC